MARHKLFAGGAVVLAALWLVALLVDKPTSAAPAPGPVSITEIAHLACLHPTMPTIIYAPRASNDRLDVIYAACSGRVWRIEVPR